MFQVCDQNIDKIIFIEVFVSISALFIFYVTRLDGTWGLWETIKEWSTVEMCLLGTCEFISLSCKYS